MPEEPRAWPNWDEVEKTVRREAYGDATELFTTLKKKLIQASVEEIDAEVEHAPLAWEFLIGFADKRALYRRQIVQVFHTLLKCPKWVEAWEAHTELQAKVRTLHEDLQAALASQHEAILKSVTPGAIQSMMFVKTEEKPEHVQRVLQKEKLVDMILTQQPKSACQFDDEPEEEASRGGSGTRPRRSPGAQALQDGIDAVVAIDTDAKLDESGKLALTRLRLGCIQCAGDEAAFHAEAEHAHQVFSFLLHYLRKGRDPVEVAEVMNQLMASPSWAAAFESSSLLREGLRELPEETQAALALQHEKLLHLVSREARRRAEAGDVSKAVKEVAPKMSGLRFPGDHPAGPSRPAPVSVADEWKTARTPEGHTYYFNTALKESTWERPASLGGPLVYTVGQPVEVWSNSLKAWGLGKVTEVSSSTVTAEFTLPNGNSAKKELPASHRDLRPAVPGAVTEAWSPEEMNSYRRWFEALPGSPPSKGSEDVAKLLYKSNLGRNALRQVWVVANPAGKPSVDFEEFARCCRLVAHCQARGLHAQPLAEADERPLRIALRTECLFRRPPKLPDFGT